ncbi:MAG TPA: methyltransferase domain-containing protein [Candidatus Krumholzibacteria bacterium]|nr:methyltransferase domain-containing protein [Candidatus Krumholzibacteria bacterium]
MLLKSVARGLLTYVPPVEKLIAKSTRGTDSARYCYSVWLRHLVLTHEGGLDDNPRVVAELGPGDSLGIGLAALLAGADHYVGLDIFAYADASRNLAIFDQIVELFTARAAIPDSTEFPEVKPYLPSYGFPAQILTEERLARCLAPERLRAIRRALENLNDESGPISIVYRVPWFDAAVVRRDSIDMVFSQAVLEHVDDLETTYTALAAWLKPGGVASHQMGFVSHKLTPEWNGHWTISEPVWKLIRGRRPYLLNREPASTHIRLIKRSGLNISNAVPVRIKSDVGRESLARRFRTMTDEDLTTKALFVQAVKPAG